MSEITDDLIVRERVEVALQFAELIAKTMDKLRSSHVFFIIMDAYEEIYPDLEWGDAQAILNKILGKEDQ